jgi:hypothetical protein
MPVTDDSGDYCYDMAHEVRAAAHPAARRRAGTPLTGMKGRELDLDGGDFGYDQAHES